MEIDNPFEMTEEFHTVFDNRRPKEPTAFSIEDASKRAAFKVEELVEFLYGASENDLDIFKEKIDELKKEIDKAQEKVLKKKRVATNPLVEEVDALIDLLYFTYGSFSLLGVDPTEIFKVVHKANMGKLFPDGKPHYDEITHKVLKPENWETDFAPETEIERLLENQKMKSKADFNQ